VLVNYCVVRQPTLGFPVMTVTMVLFAVATITPALLGLFFLLGRF
jgi:hypothetical protein